MREGIGGSNGRIMQTFLFSPLEVFQLNRFMPANNAAYLYVASLVYCIQKRKKKKDCL